MTQQIVVIHGGGAFATYEEYITNLRAAEVDLQSLTVRDWKGRLEEVLSQGYEVILLDMPNPQNAKYLDWKIWFEKYIPFLRDGVVLIGHSLGGIFVAKYLSEENFPKSIRATFLVAPPFDQDGDRGIVEFVLPVSLKGFEQQGGETFIYHSRDDPIVQFAQLAKYQRALPKAHITVFEDRQHFMGEAFPEIAEAIRRL